ncbi:MAG: AbrB/MazE/SpoVT family DNA-binding domain-containing protein [Acidimicrobiaceae bacterium]|nr:AbrB/MazE/SpoVT family DNA-binding domain-containing protein [Acidimicrobiaceae bacterium]
MDVSARVTSKGQVTIPKSVREALALEVGDRVMFRVEQHRAIIARTPDLIEMAGAVEVPAAQRGANWDQIRSATRAQRARRYGEGMNDNSG